MVLRGTSLYLADQQDHVIRRIDLTTGTISVVAGMGAANGQGDGGPATVAGINAPWDLDFDSSGNMYIAAMSNHRIRKVDTTGQMSTFYGTGATTVLNNPQGVGLDGSDNVFVADTGNGRIVKITPGGVGATFGAGFALTEPTNIAFDSAGNVLVSDCNSGLDGAIYRYNAAGTARTLIAGNGTSTFADGVAATAGGLDCPRGMTVDTTTDTVYLAEAGSNRIRRFTIGGNISTIAGNRWATYSGDGGAATAAQLYHPGGADFDSSDTMYIADTDNNRIRKVTGGVISTVAGTGLASGPVGDGAAATSARCGNHRTWRWTAAATSTSPTSG
jgi:sugar lactone lactonase YvrE